MIAAAISANLFDTSSKKVYIISRQVDAILQSALNAREIRYTLVFQSCRGPGSNKFVGNWCVYIRCRSNRDVITFYFVSAPGRKLTSTVIIKDSKKSMRRRILINVKWFSVICVSLSINSRLVVFVSATTLQSSKLLQISFWILL